MLKRIICLFLVVILGSSCSNANQTSCKDQVDEVSLLREFDEENGEFKLLLDIDRTELPNNQRPIAIFVIPDRIAPPEGFRYGQFWEKVDSDSAVGRQIQAILSTKSDQIGNLCKISEDKTLSECQVVMVSMMGLVGSCCKYPLAYTASIYLTTTPELESNILTAIAIPEDIQGENNQCIQISFP